MTRPTPSPMQTPDIGSLLRRPPSVAGPTPPATPREVELSGAVVAVTSPAPEPGAPSKQKRAPRVPSGRQYLRSIAVYLPRSVHQQLKTEAADRGTTATALMLAAVNATHGQVGGQLDQLRRGAAGPASGGPDLFEIPQARPAAEPSVQTTIRVTDEQLQAITELAAKHTTNRSQLITAALQLYLPAMS